AASRTSRHSASNPSACRSEEPSMFARKLIPVLAVLLGASACVLPAGTVEPAFTVTAGYGYNPPRYQGYVVYYDGGVPFYVVEGRRYYVPRDSRYYDRYIGHYRRYNQS